MGKRKPYVAPQMVTFTSWTLESLDTVSYLLNLRPSCAVSLCTELRSMATTTGEAATIRYDTTTPPKGISISGEVAREWMLKADLRTLDMLRPACLSCTRCRRSE